MAFLVRNPTLTDQEARAGLPILLVIAAAVAGIAQRAWLLAGPLGAMNSDEVVSTMVSTEVLQGRFTAFIPHLSHGATILAYPRAPLIALFGNNPVVTKGVEIAVFALACVVVWRIGRRLFDDRVGKLAALLLWVFPPAAVWASTKVMLYYAPSMVFSSLVVLVCVRLYQDQRPNDFAWLGLLCGLALWSHPMALYVVIPVVGWLAVTCRRILVHAWRAVPAAVVGAMPWLWSNLHNDFSSLRDPGTAVQTTYGERFVGFFEALLPRALGLRHPYGGDWYFEPLSWVAYGVVLAGVVVAVWRWRGERRLLLVVGLAFPFLFAVPAASIHTAEPRYAMTLLPVLALGGAYAASRLRWRAITPPVVLALATAASTISLQHLLDTSSDANLVLRPPPTDEIWEYLDANGIDTIYADYWLAYRLVWEDRRDLTVLPIYADYYELTEDHREGASVAVFYGSGDWADRWANQFGQLRTVSTKSYDVVYMPETLPVDAPGLFPLR